MQAALAKPASLQGCDVVPPEYRKYKISKISKEALDVRTIYFEPADGEVSAYKAGQFFIFRLPQAAGKAKPHFRSFSALVVHKKNEFQLGIKLHRHKDGDERLGSMSGFTEFLFNHVKEGDEAELSGPYGNFVLPEKSEGQAVFLAAGIGITPLLCMIEEMAKKKATNPILLFYSNRHCADTAYRERIMGLRARMPNFTPIFSITGEELPPDWKGEKGRITSEMLKRHGIDFSSAHFYTCGPKEFIGHMHEVVVSSGAKSEQFHKEAW